MIRLIKYKILSFRYLEWPSLFAVWSHVTRQSKGVAVVSLASVEGWSHADSPRVSPSCLEISLENIYADNNTVHGSTSKYLDDQGQASDVCSNMTLTG